MPTTVPTPPLILIAARMPQGWMLSIGPDQDSMRVAGLFSANSTLAFVLTGLRLGQQTLLDARWTHPSGHDVRYLLALTQDFIGSIEVAGVVHTGVRHLVFGCEARALDAPDLYTDSDDDE